MQRESNLGGVKELPPYPQTILGFGLHVISNIWYNRGLSLRHKKSQPIAVGRLSFDSLPGILVSRLPSLGDYGRTAQAGAFNVRSSLFQNTENRSASQAESKDIFLPVISDRPGRR